VTSSKLCKHLFITTCIEKHCTQPLTCSTFCFQYWSFFTIFHPFPTPAKIYQVFVRYQVMQAGCSAQQSSCKNGKNWWQHGGMGMLRKSYVSAWHICPDSVTVNAMHIWTTLYRRREVSETSEKKVRPQTSK